MAEEDLSLWTLEPAYGGWNLVSAGITSNPNTRLALEFYSGRFTTYNLSSSGIYIFNFYEAE